MPPLYTYSDVIDSLILVTFLNVSDTCHIDVTLNLMAKVINTICIACFVICITYITEM